MTNANKAIASTRAKPNIVMVKTSFLAAGFLPTAVIKAAKTLPIPIPAPPADVKTPTYSLAVRIPEIVALPLAKIVAPTPEVPKFT